jgi:hypothetical protein
LDTFIENAEWISVCENFAVARENYVNLRLAIQEGRKCDHEEFERVERIFKQAIRTASTFPSSNPYLLDEKLNMAADMLAIAAATYEGWLEYEADLMRAGAGAPPLPGMIDEEPAVLSPIEEVTWAPAKAFWAKVNTGKSPQNELQFVLESKPKNERELADQARIVAWGGCATYCGKALATHVEADPMVPLLSAWTARLMKMTTDELISGICDPRNFNTIVANNQSEIVTNNMSGPDLMRLLIGAATLEWRKTIWINAKTLGLVGR